MSISHGAPLKGRPAHPPPFSIAPWRLCSIVSCVVSLSPACRPPHNRADRRFNLFPASAAAVPPKSLRPLRRFSKPAAISGARPGEAPRCAACRAETAGPEDRPRRFSERMPSNGAVFSSLRSLCLFLCVCPVCPALLHLLRIRLPALLGMNGPEMGQFVREVENQGKTCEIVSRL